MISVLLGDGTGGFAPASEVSVGLNPHSIVAADLDGDGLPDLAVANLGSSDVSLLRGNGDGTFEPAQQHPAGTGPHSIRTADLNADGRLDLVTANEGSANVTVLLGTGTTGVFAPGVSHPTGPTPKGVLIVDIDADGVLDVLASTIAGNYPTIVAPDGGAVTILHGTGDGTFTDPLEVPMGTAPFAVVAGTLDSDAQVDLITADWHSGGVVIRLGRSTTSAVAAS